MSLRINHNIASINSHRNLLYTNKSMGKSLEKLSSGMAINRAGDGPASLVISEQMRAQVSGLNQAIANSETAVSLVQTAEAALNETNNLLIRMRQLAIHAANEGANDDVMLKADQAEINNSIDTINRISRETQFGTKPLLNGSRGANGVATGKNLEFIEASVYSKASPVGGFAVELTQTASKSFKKSGVLTREMIDAGEKITLVEGGRAMVFQTEKGQDVDTVVNSLALQMRRTGLNLTVKKNEDDTLVITHKEFGAEHEFLVGSSSAGFFSAEANVSVKSDAGRDIKGFINGELALGKGQILTGKRGTSHIDGLAIRYLGTEEIKKDEKKRVGTVAVAQNSMVFQVGGNANQIVMISLRDTSAKSLGRGTHNQSGFKSLEEMDVQNYQGAQDSLHVIDVAINQISETRSQLGAFQKNNLESNLSNLRIAQENMISAESAIRDTDMAMEMANLVKNQMMSQSGTAMLAHSNQMPKALLSLLAAN